MNKKKVIVLSVIGFTIFCMLAAMTACTAIFVNELEKEAEREEQKIEQQIEQQKEENPAVEDEYLNEKDIYEYLPEPEQNSGAAMEFVKPMVDEAFAGLGLDYYLIEETADDGLPTIILILNMPVAEIEAGIEAGQWNALSEEGLLVTEVMREALITNGYDVHFGIMIGDIEQDAVYFAAADGMLIMDVPNGVQ